MSYRIAIPSYQRPDVLMNRTLTTLMTLDVDPNIIDIFVSDWEQYDIYRDKLPRVFRNLFVGKVGMMPIRRVIHQNYFEGQHLVCIDDDIAGLYRKIDDKTYVPLTGPDFGGMVATGFSECQEHGAKLWGIYPVLNAMFMKHRIRRDLRYIVGAFWGCINSHQEERMGTQEYKEDFERSIRWYHQDGAVIRLEAVAPKTSYYNTPGGMQVERTPDKEAEGARALAHDWPQYCDLNTSKKSGFVEVRLRDKTSQKRTVLS